MNKSSTMSEPKPPSKNKNKKKKAKAVAQSEIAPPVDVVCPNPVKLPQKINETTYINEVQVTMAEKKEEIAPKKSKNAKKKAAKAEKRNQIKSNSLENANDVSPVIPVVSEAEQPLFTFSRGGSVEIKHLPEITVTRMDESVLNTPPTNAIPVEQPANDVSNSTATTKKKKKKKKKKSVNQETNGENNAKISPGATSEPVSSEPTYVKMPTTDDAVVLVVSHESFGNSEASKKKISNQPISMENYNAKKSPLQDKSSPQNFSFASSEVIITPTTKISEIDGTPQPYVTISRIRKDPSLVASLARTGPETVKTHESEVSVTCESPSSVSVSNPGNQKTKQQVEKQASPEVQKPSKSTAKSPDSQEPAKPSEGNMKVKTSKIKAPSEAKDKKSHQSRFVSHLPQFKPYSVVSRHLESRPDMHPAVITVGALYAEGIITGSDARCVALLGTLRDVVRDYITPPNKELYRELQPKLQECVNFISKCRPLSVSMSNSLKVITHYMSEIPRNVTDEEAKSMLCSRIIRFVEEEICLAKKAISGNATDKIVEGDVILTFAYSSVVKDVLFEAFNEKSFRVIVVDNRSKAEGRKMFKDLVKHGITCTFVSIGGTSHLMREVTKVIIGASALQANGSVISRLGSSEIASLSFSCNVSFLVCCETYKFSESVHVGPLICNELGDPERFLKASSPISSVLENWKNIRKLKLLNLLYDVTPPVLVSMVITEKGNLPCTSVPVVLRVRSEEEDLSVGGLRHVVTRR